MGICEIELHGFSYSCRLAPHAITSHNLPKFLLKKKHISNSKDKKGNTSQKNEGNKKQLNRKH